jgi:uncharacterized protein
MLETILPCRAIRRSMALAAVLPLVLSSALAQEPAAAPPATSAVAPEAPGTRTVEVPFKSHDGHEMLGKLTMPTSPGKHPVVVYVQNAEAMTADMRRPSPRGGTFNYFDLYREKLAGLKVGFFGYEGRGVHAGDTPPRYERIDWDVYNTSTIENKVRDVLTAVGIVQKHPGVDPAQVYLMGTSEGTLLAAQAAARAPKEIKGLVLYAVLSSTLKDALKYMSAEGNFLMLRQFFDMDKDGRISLKEFVDDPRRLRRGAMPNVEFKVFDLNEDGHYTVDEARARVKELLQAVDTEKLEVVDAYLAKTAVVSIPKGWVKDEFAQAPMWSFLSKLDMPVGLFHGTHDNLTDVEGVRKLEEQARTAGKTNLEFHYFDGLDHSLGIVEYFVRGTLPAGHKAIFDYVARQVGSARELPRPPLSTPDKAPAKGSR